MRPFPASRCPTRPRPFPAFPSASMSCSPASTIKGAGAHGPSPGQSEKFALHALTYGRRQDIYEAAGQQTLSLDGWRRQTASHHLSCPVALRASAIIDAKGLARFDLDMVDAGGKDSDGRPSPSAGPSFICAAIPRSTRLDLMVSADQASRPAGLPHQAVCSAYATLTRRGLGAAAGGDAVLAGGGRRLARRRAARHSGPACAPTLAWTSRRDRQSADVRSTSFCRGRNSAPRCPGPAR